MQRLESEQMQLQGEKQVAAYLYSTLNSRIRWRQWGLESPGIPAPRTLVAIPERVHPKPLFLAFVPRAFVAMAIGKAVNTEPVDLVPEVLAGIPITISKMKIRIEIRHLLPRNGRVRVCRIGEI
jgi:hypothetical protein